MELKHLSLLAEKYPGIAEVEGEIAYLKTLLALPKETEFYFSDLHGEDGAVIHLLRSASGTVRSKIRQIFGKILTQDQQNQLANLVYNPDRVLELIKESGRLSDEWVTFTIYRLVELLRFVSSKYPRARVREKTPQAYHKVIEELLYYTSVDEDRDVYNDAIVQAIISSQTTESFIKTLCLMIQSISVDTLHIIGDIFDRGPGPHKIMEELMSYPNVDIQWGNHDVIWMGAGLGSEACMMNVLRVALGYNNFDCLEDGYGINLRPLYSFAHEVYGDDPCDLFMPKILDENVYDRVSPEITAKMHKAIAIMQFKLEGQVLNRHPEYEMDQRNVLQKVDWDKMVYVEGGKEYPLKDRNFPTIDPADPLKLSPEEEDLLVSIRASFTHSEVLHRHVDYLFKVGGSYKCHNHQLLFHGCIPMTDDGEFMSVSFKDGQSYSGKSLMDYLDREIRKAKFAPKGSSSKQDSLDLLWYLWCGAKSPMFGKSKMATFENFFVADPAVRKEVYNAYYTVALEPEVCNKILLEFGLDPEKAHIFNGHVPVKIKDGETPVKAGGKLFVIDGGIAKAYQSRTGIAGYTMIFNSHYMAIVEHKSFSSIENDVGDYNPAIEVVEYMPYRWKVEDTSAGADYREQIKDLEDLARYYRSGGLGE